MSSSQRAVFMATLKRALKRGQTPGQSLDTLVPRQPNADDRRLMAHIAGRDATDHQALLDRLIRAGKSVNVDVIVETNAASAGDAVVEIAADRRPEWGDGKSVVAWDHPLINSLALTARLEALAIPVHTAAIESQAIDRQPSIRHLAETAMIGITSADYAVAETATLSMKTRRGQPRCISLLPSIHIAVIRLEQILATLNELYTLFKWNPTEQAEGLTHSMTFITGPSKTADIEATLVHGAHGPRELVIIVLTG